MTAKNLYQKLLRSGIKNSLGYVNFTFLDSTVRVTAKSAVGYVFQDWLEKWLGSNNISYQKNPNSQEWPDFFLEPDEDNCRGLVELKTFEVDEGPNFDIANFDAYQRSLKTNAFRLDADYLIFCYKLDKNGNFSIKDLWLKKVWNISSPSGKLPIKCQVKQNVIVNIRPAKWFSQNIKNPVFSSRKQFVEAINKTLLGYLTRSSESKDWLKDITTDYKEHTGKNL